MKKLENTLSIIHSAGITTKDALCRNQTLYSELFLDIENFVTTTALRSHVNINRLLRLKEFGVDIEDIKMELLIKIVSKLDNILSKELEHMIPYMYLMVNRYLIDVYRTVIKEASTVVSLDEIINSHEANNDSRKTKTREDYLLDKKGSTESNFLVKETILDVYHKHSNNADALLVTLGTTIMGDKVNEIANRLLIAGSVSSVLAEYQKELSDMYSIDLDELPTVAAVKKTGLSKTLAKKNTTEQDISAKISNILYRNK